MEKLDDLEKLASFVSANSAEKVATPAVHLLASNLASYIHKILGLHSSGEPPARRKSGGRVSRHEVSRRGCRRRPFAGS